MDNNVAVIILAAGLGTRMKSGMAKVLHTIMGKAMILHVLETAERIAGTNIVVVVGHQADQVSALVERHITVRFALQAEQLGTGHAVMCAMPEVPSESEHIMILCGDVPLLTPETLQRLLDDHFSNQRDLTILAIDAKNPTGYGRVIMDARGNLTGIVEEADADENQKRISVVNAGIYCAKRMFLKQALAMIDADNAQKELYLTDIVAVGYRQGARLGVVLAPDADEIIGVNSVAELKQAEILMKKRAVKLA